MKKIHIDGNEWTYTIGRQNIKIRSPFNKSFVVGIHDLFGVYPDEIERAKRKGSPYEILPSVVKDHIIKNNLKEIKGKKNAKTNQR